MLGLKIQLLKILTYLQLYNQFQLMERLIVSLLRIQLIAVRYFHKIFLGNLSIDDAFLTIQNSNSLLISNLIYKNCFFDYAMALQLINVRNSFINNISIQSAQVSFNHLMYFQAISNIMMNNIFITQIEALTT